MMAVERGSIEHISAIYEREGCRDRGLGPSEEEEIVLQCAPF